MSSTAASSDGLRRFDPSDHRLAQILIGASVMEQLPTVNARVYRNPAVIALWFAVSAGFMKLVGWMPQLDQPRTYLSPVVALFTCAIPVMIGFEFVHRSPFDRLMRATVGAPDIAFLQEYYSLDPAGGFWVYQHDGRVVALVALDVVRPRQALESLIAADELPSAQKNQLEAELRSKLSTADEQADVAANSTAKTSATDSDEPVTRNRKSAATTAVANDAKPEADSNLAKLGIAAPATAPTTAAIRHLYVDLPYVGSPLLPDLVEHALAHAFGPETSVQTVLVEDAVGRPQYRPVLEQVGFRPVKDEGKPVGVFGLAGRDRWLQVGREKWTSRASL